MRLKLDAGKESRLLADILTEQGVLLPMPCGGQGTCGKCAVRVLQGKAVPLMPAQEARLKAEGLLAPDAHLGCQLKVQGALELELLQKDERNLYIPENSAAEGSHDQMLTDQPLAVLIDIGTTTICLALTDLRGEQIFAVHALLNRQRRYGADVISRIRAAGEGHPGVLQDLVLEDIQTGIGQLLEKAGGRDSENIRDILIAGNTTMLHLLRGWDVSCLGAWPFTPVSLEMAPVTLPGYEHASAVTFPGISAYVGADIAAGLYSLHDERGPYLFMDLGTNAEMALVTDRGVWVTSAAAGPAFEGANISCGTGSIPGAVRKAFLQYGLWRYETIGKEPPSGICGSGLISCVAALKQAKLIDNHGTLRDNYHGYVDIVPGKIRITQADIRAFQEAKAAVRSGVALLLDAAGLQETDVKHAFLAGSFGGGLDISDACTAGLLPASFAEKTKVCGNAVLAGLRRYLADADPEVLRRIIQAASVIDLSQQDDFNATYIDHLDFE